jgi:acyl-coenzyme A synthetase/AMP-(fatty) acid ligase
MKPLADRPATFLDRILANQDRDQVLLRFGGGTIRQSDLAQRSCFEARNGFAGLSVLIAAAEPVDCVLPLIELDGVARRLVICPSSLPDGQLAEIAAAADTDVIVADAGFRASPQIAERYRIVRSAGLVHHRSATDHWAATEWVLLTSGTTGTPKLVSHGFESLTSNIRRPDTQGEPIVWASFNDTRRFSGLQMFLQAMLTGSTLVLRPSGTPVPEFIKILAETQATHVSGTPTHWRKVLMFPGRGDMKFRQITLVGEIADQALLDGLRAAYPDVRITHIYGSTEAGTGFSVHDGLAGFPASFVGREHKGIELRVDGETLKIKSRRASKGYIGAVDALHDDGGFMDTGDLVQLVGGRYQFLGRKSGAINIGGSRVHPEEVEAVLNADPDVRMSLVTSRKSPFTGSILVAQVVMAGRVDRGARSREAIVESLLERCRRSLDPHKVPATVKIVDDIATGASGKLGRPAAS